MTTEVNSLLSPNDLVCRCMAYESHELWRLWQRRAQPTVRRLLGHGRRVDQARIQRTLELIRSIDSGRPEAFSVANWARSHHLPDCQFHGRRTPLAAVDAAPEAAWRASL